MPSRDGSGWLGCQDSNLQMTFREMPFEMSGRFRLNSEHIATRDFSRVRCRNGEKHPLAALAPASQARTGLYVGIGEIGRQKRPDHRLEDACLHWLLTDTLVDPLRAKNRPFLVAAALA
jgi:hypothetical protein